MAKYGRWCVNGCGKKVMYTGIDLSGFKFRCTKCGKKYKEKEECL